MANPGGAMNAEIQTPPRWVEIFLERLLTARDRQTVTGDLREQYAESILPRHRRLKADLWYLRQVLSFVPRSLSEGGPMRKVLLLVSLFTLACGVWLAAMECVLRHPGYVVRIAVAICIGLISLATILARMLHLGFRCERWLWVGAVALIGIGGQAFVRNARSAHFEGFVFLISLALVLQGLLMLLSLGRSEGSNTHVSVHGNGQS
jgi:hypothetical protein